MAGAHRTHAEVRGEFITTPQDEAELAAFKAEALAEVARMRRLVDVRQERGLTQTDLADRLGITQTAVSKIERSDLARSELGTVRRYVEALGGRLEIVADFDGERLTLD